MDTIKETNLIVLYTCVYMPIARCFVKADYEPEKQHRNLNQSTFANGSIVDKQTLSGYILANLRLKQTDSSTSSVRTFANKIIKS